MGKMRSCGVRNAEGKMRNEMCGATVIGRDVTPRDGSYSAFHHTPCVDSLEVKCMLCISLNISCTFHYVPRTATLHFSFFLGDFLRILFIKSKSIKIDNNFILYHLPNAHTCATSINAEIKNFVQQLPKTNAQRKT